MRSDRAAGAGMITWICSCLSHTLLGEWTADGADAVFYCACGTKELNRAYKFFRPQRGITIAPRRGRVELITTAIRALEP